MVIRMKTKVVNLLQKENRCGEVEEKQGVSDEEATRNRLK